MKMKKMHVQLKKFCENPRIKNNENQLSKILRITYNELKKI